MVELTSLRERIKGNPRVQYMSYMSKFVAAFVALLLMALIASRQLFLFTVFSDPAALSTAAERSHLWLAAIAGLTACTAGAFMFYFFSRHETNKWSKVAMTPTGPRDLIALNALNPLARAPFNAARWAVANPWLSEGEPDDRTPMDSSARNIGVPPSEQRAFTRQTHQLMFKKWSQARHD
jgi:hypothetical protein